MEPYLELGMLRRASLPVDRSLADHFFRLLKVFSRFLPDMKATFSIFDQPQIYLSWARRGSLVDLGLRNERESSCWTSLMEDTTHLQETDSAHVRLTRSCPPSSHFRNNSAFYEGRLSRGSSCK